MCIYFGNSPTLTYIKQEHVFPAGLGGKQKLPNGYVSDQANELFSPMELQLMRQSLISFDRMMFGPGDRGSLRANKASKSLVTVGTQTEGGQIVLSYTALGKPYNIPQIHIKYNTIEVSLPNEHNDHRQSIKRFMNALYSFKDKFVFLSCKELPSEDMIIGYNDSKYYVAASGDRPSIESVKKRIEFFLSIFQQREIHEGEHHVKQSHLLVENGDIARIYAKVALNSLAWLKGENYLANPAFNKIKQWILTGTGSDTFFYLPSILTPETDSLVKMFPQNAHWCLFCRVGNTLAALVCFYNRYMRQFTLCDLTDNTAFRFPEGFICDWSKEQEYTLDQYISHLATDNHPKFATKL